MGHFSLPCGHVNTRLYKVRGKQNFSLSMTSDSSRIKNGCHTQARHCTLADVVSITFRFQKNKKKEDTVTQYRSMTIPCPVTAWAAVVIRILGYPGTTGDSPVNTFLAGKTLIKIPSKTILASIRVTVTAIGVDILGFYAHEVGTHSIRSSCAMALYLAPASIVTIMHIGRWSSDAFLLYIRKQVQEFSKNLTSQMVKNAQFFTIPSVTEHTVDFDTADFNDPRTRNPNSFASSICISGPNGSTSRVNQTAYHVWG